ncbi:MAG: PilW family protein [Planctomycetota bacterium]|jgi:type II secretory pathway pseudopilin PulG
MQYRNNKIRFSKAMTLLETIIAMVLMAIIIAVLVPQFRLINNSWDSKVGASETLQNGRVLIDHLNHNLSKASRITAVSDSSETNGYIEFIDNDVNNVRYDVNSISNYVEFGPIGSPSDLAGPVSQLRFTCYDAYDLDTPVTDVNVIRNVKVETTITNSATLGQDMTFSTQAYIRTNNLPTPGYDISKISEPWLEFDMAQGMEPALVHISGTKFLCAYRGDRDDGWACVLTVIPSGWSVIAGNFFEYDTKSGITPHLVKIDDSHALCAYQGDRGDGWACLFYEWPVGSGIFEAGPALEFDIADCRDPSMCNMITQGNDHYFLCAYAASYEVRAVVLKARITDFMMALSVLGAGASFAGAFAPTPALAKIDDTHYLCVYQGQNGGVHGGAVVLTVNNPVDGNINVGTHFDFLGESAGRLELAQIDDTHYLCTYETSNDGRATVLTVNPADWTVTKNPGPDFLVAQLRTSTSQLCQVDSTNFLFVYPELASTGAAVLLTVNTGDWSISKGTPCTFDPTDCLTPTICQIDTDHYLCAYRGVDADGFAGVLELGTGDAILP